ncbi:hypothetical protein SELMODRAFT_411567 [Selaginella moellendorffii]|uniref:F-box domain-containing protein n=1 Tax=Selaginella moellendorffii TaxID=88036 RepID=D8RIC4_SELML|nr:hypothetical protein SELMODRAFT_411567 [Selaginella moellendorffii]
MEAQELVLVKYKGLWMGLQMNQELEEEVLQQLPLRDVWQMRAVCKRWRELIDSPGFGVRHAQANIPAAIPYVLAGTLCMFRGNPFNNSNAFNWIEMEVLVGNPVTGCFRAFPDLRAKGLISSSYMGISQDFKEYTVCFVKSRSCEEKKVEIREYVGLFTLDLEGLRFELKQTWPWDERLHRNNGLFVSCHGRTACIYGICKEKQVVMLEVKIWLKVLVKYPMLYV